jgi:hypothetical protein
MEKIFAYDDERPLGEFIDFIFLYDDGCWRSKPSDGFDMEVRPSENNGKEYLATAREGGETVAFAIIRTVGQLGSVLKIIGFEDFYLRTREGLPK